MRSTSPERRGRVILTGTVFGRITFSNEATMAFESGSVNTDFRYYISGPDNYPKAIIGLHRDHCLDTQSLWREVEMTPEVMHELVGNMKHLASTRIHFLYGFDLVDPDGKKIGVWYSLKSEVTCMQMKKDGNVRIDTPDLEIYDQLNEHSGPMNKG